MEQLRRVLWERNGPDSHRFCRLTRKINRRNGLTLAGKDAPPEGAPTRPLPM